MLSLARYAWRSWRGSATTAVLAIIALALGIGSATAIYTVAEAVLLKPLPYHDAGRFVAVYGAQTNQPAQKSFLSYNNLREFTQKQRSFDLFGWFTYSSFNLTFAGEPEHVNAIRSTPSLLRGLGVNPKMGRWFDDESDRAVISDRLWRRLGSHPDIIGKPLKLDGRSYTVTAVMPGWFRLPLASPDGSSIQTDVWIPLDPQYEHANIYAGQYFCYAHLKPGVTYQQALADVKRIAAEYAREHKDDHSLDSAKLETLREVVSQDFRPTLLLLIAATALLLLITCANVSGLLVTRAVARARETAIRLALGAAQSKLLLQYFSEGLLISLLGAFCGVALSIALVQLIVTLGADVIVQADQISVDATALLFAIAAAFFASLLTSLAPLWQALRTAPNEVLNDGVRASAGFRSRRLSQALVVAEIALTFTLLATGALLIAQLNRLNRVNPGFDPRGLTTFQLSYGDANRLAQYQNVLLDEIKNTPGITSATLSNHLPLNGCCFSTTVFPEGAPERYDSKRVSFVPTTPDYLATMRIPLRAGRFLTARDTHEKLLNVVINQAAANHYWPHGALGAYGRLESVNGTRFQVIGIAGDVRNDGLNNPTVPEMYLLSSLTAPNPAWFIVRSPLPEKMLIAAIRNTIRRVNPEQPIYDVRPYQEIIDDSLTYQRASSLLTSFFAAAALLLAALGIYGVVAYSVRQRTVEIGTRMALGAETRDLWKLVLGGGFKMTAAGLVAGAIAAAVASVALVKSSVVQGVEPWPFVYSTLLIALITLAGSFYPAWRATQLSPMVAIRNEPGGI